MKHARDIRLKDPVLQVYLEWLERHYPITIRGAGIVACALANNAEPLDPRDFDVEMEELTLLSATWRDSVCWHTQSSHLKGDSSSEFERRG